MKFCGIQKTSLIDFPERLATVLFTPGCNLRCPFCHNWRIVVNPSPPFLDEKSVIEILIARKRFVDSVVLTGGEPSQHQDLPMFVKTLKTYGFKIKVDTNGFFPEILTAYLDHVDYVALDVKTSLEKYSRLGAKDLNPLLKSVEILKKSSIQYEFRTTVVPSLINADDIPKIGEIVKGSKLFVFQQFVPNDTLDKTFQTLLPYPASELTKFADEMKQYVQKTVLRI